MQGRRDSTSLTLLLFGVLQAMLFAYYFVHSIHPIPRWDFYDWITGYLEQHALWQWLWALHNEHRIIISKLVVALDIELFAGQLYPIALLTVVTLLTWVSVLYLVVMRNIEASNNARFAITGIVLLLGFPTFTLDAYAYPTNMQFAFVTCFFVLTVCSYLKVWVSRQTGMQADKPLAATKWLCLSLLLAVCCSISSVNGLFVWIVLAWMTWRLGNFSIGTVTALTSVACFTIVVYAMNFSAAQPGPYYPHSIAEVDRFLEYLVAYFGMPWVAIAHLKVLGLLIGGAIVTTACIACVWKGFLSARIESIEVIGVALLMFSGLTGLVTSFGRMGAAELPAHRYTLFAVLAHFGIFLTLLPTLLRINLSAHTWRPALPLAALLIGSAILLQQIIVGQFASHRAEHFALLRDEILAGDRSPEVTKELYPDPQRLEYHLQLLSAKKLSIYGDDATLTAANGL